MQMNNASICPVPKDQIPICEYQVLSNSSFSSWPINGKLFLYKKLIQSWIISLPITLFISSGSIELIKSTPILILESASVSLLVPLLLLFRLILNWKYIYKRLYSYQVEYEESGWYDGQIWEKPIDFRTKDLLIAQNDVAPLITTLNQSILIIMSLFTFGLLTLSIIM